MNNIKRCYLVDKAGNEVCPNSDDWWARRVELKDSPVVFEESLGLDWREDPSDVMKLVNVALKADPSITEFVCFDLGDDSYHFATAVKGATHPTPHKCLSCS